MNRLAGKTCVVTAAARGIGRATAERMAAEGARVFAADIDENALSEVRSVERRALDVVDPRAISAFARETGRVDVLFNCAGFVHNGNILECEEEDWDFSLALNVKSMYRMTRAFLPEMLAAGGGAIINMSSVASSIKGVLGRFVYSATKAAVIGLTKSVAADFVAQGVRCNAICPGTVDSPSLRDRLRATGDYDAAMKQFIARQPMGRLGKCEEIAALAAYLASDEAKFVTGQTFVIDGGWAN
ncbi:MAG: SDR family oxidoreductase [Gammaproteobacteria bacterium]